MCDTAAPTSCRNVAAAIVFELVAVSQKQAVPARYRHARQTWLLQKVITHILSKRRLRAILPDGLAKAMRGIVLVSRVSGGTVSRLEQVPFPRIRKLANPRRFPRERTLGRTGLCEALAEVVKARSLRQAAAHAPGNHTTAQEVDLVGSTTRVADVQRTAGQPPILRREAFQNGGSR